MSQVELVALWTGLIASVVGIVLSIVAISFSVLVNRRSDEISNKTIQALQKIESAVERQSDDTRNLIKAAWDKLLGAVDRPLSRSDASAKELAGGIASELRAELSAIAPTQGTGIPHASVQKLEELFKQFESNLAIQLKAGGVQGGPGAKLDLLTRQVSGLSAAARAFIAEVRGSHIALDEYRRMRDGELGPVLKEVREAGLIIPVQHRHRDGTEEPCYYFPAGTAQLLSVVLPMFPPPSGQIAGEIRAAMSAAGYSKKKHEHKPPRGEETH